MGRERRLGSTLTFSDMFCGAGGFSLGAKQAGIVPRLGLNHWQRAIETHNANFPNMDHDCTDIHACNPRRYPTTDVLLASPECTNHSIAKGVKRRDSGQLGLFNDEVDPAAERSRATMWDVVRFAEVHRYRIIIVENVVDVRHWECWEGWLVSMQNLGYEYQAVYLNSQFFEVCQSRDRIFIVFWRRGNPRPDLDFRPRSRCANCGIVEAVQSWKRPDRQWGRYGEGSGGQYVYRCPKCGKVAQPGRIPAAAAIDWTVPAPRIGDRKKTLQPKTIDRIQAGLRRFAGRDLVVANYSPGWTRPLETGVFGSVTTKDHNSICLTPGSFLASYYGNGENVSGVDSPIPTVTAKERCGLITPPFFVETAYPPSENESRAFSSANPLPTQTTRQSMAVVTAPFVMSSGGSWQAYNHPVSPDQPFRVFTTRESLALIDGGVIPMIFETRGRHPLRAAGEPMGTVVGSATHHYLLNVPLAPVYGNGRDDREENHGIEGGLFESVDESENTASLDCIQSILPKVEDCGFRMLNTWEIQSAMAFPRTYVVTGTKKEKVRQLGNAVTYPVAKWLVERAVASLEGSK